MWKRPVDHFLDGPLGIAPLAVLAHLPKGIPLEQGLAGVIGRLCERFLREAPPEKFGKLLTSAYVLTGLRVERQRAWTLFRGVQGMQESDTFQAILDEGRVEALQKTILRQGRKLFGPADEGTTAAVAATDDVQRLEFLSDRLLDVKSWHDLLAH